MTIDHVYFENILIFRIQIEDINILIYILEARKNSVWSIFLKGRREYIYMNSDFLVTVGCTLVLCVFDLVRFVPIYIF